MTKKKIMIGVVALLLVLGGMGVYLYPAEKELDYKKIYTAEELSALSVADREEIRNRKLCSNDGVDTSEPHGDVGHIGIDCSKYK